MKLNIYSESGEIVKSYEAKVYDIEFGTIRKFMKLVRVDEAKDIGEIFTALAESWDEIVAVLGRIFPECTDEEWDRVKLKELIPLVINISKYAIKESFKISSKN